MSETEVPNSVRVSSAESSSVRKLSNQERRTRALEERSGSREDVPAERRGDHLDELLWLIEQFGRYRTQQAVGSPLSGTRAVLNRENAGECQTMSTHATAWSAYQRTCGCRYRTREVAGSSPASSIS